MVLGILLLPAAPAQEIGSTFNSQPIAVIEFPEVGAPAEVLKGVIVDPEGGFYTVASTYPYGPDQQLLSVKFGGDGQAVWWRTHPGLSIGGAVDLALMNDHLWIAGAAFAKREYLFHQAAIRYSLTNSALETVALTPVSSDDATSWRIDPRGNIYATYGSILAKYDAQGIVKWTRTLLIGNAIIRGESVIEVDAENSVIVAGRSSSPNPQANFAAFKFNAEGRLLWSVPVLTQTNSYDTVFEVIPDKMGNIVIAGSSYSSSRQRTRHCVSKIDSDGQVQWTRDLAAKVISAANDGSIFIGESTGVAKLDPDGREIWHSRGFAADVLAVTPEGDLYAAGPVRGENWVDYGIRLFQINSAGTRVLVADYAPSNVGIATPMLLKTSVAGNLILGSQFAQGSGPVSVVLLYVPPTIPHDLPRVARPPDSRIVEEGNSAMFEAFIEGSEPAQIQWMFNYTRLPNETNRVLTLEEVDATDSGDYWFTLKNGAGEVASPAGRLTVLTRPDFLQEPSEQFTYLGTTVEFRTKVIGTEPIHLQWRFNGIDLPNETNTTLRIENVRSTDSGKYSVRAVNEVGSIDSRAATLTVSPTVRLSGAFQHPLFSVSQITFDALGNAYVFGHGGASKFGPDGSERWHSPFDTERIAPGPDESTYVLGRSSVRKLDGFGDTNWTIHQLYWITSAAADGSGDLYVSHRDGISKLNSAGEIVWTRPEIGWIQTNPEGGVYSVTTSAEQGQLDYGLIKIALDGTETWSVQFDSGSRVSGWTVGPYGNVFVTRVASGAFEISKHSGDGTVIWNVRYNPSHFSQRFDEEPDSASITVDRRGDVWVGLYSYVWTDSTSMPGTIAVARFDVRGNRHWISRRRIFSPRVYEQRLATDAYGNLYRTHYRAGLQKYSPEGTLLWDLQLTSVGLAIHPHTGDAFLLSGLFAGQIGTRVEEPQVEGAPRIVNPPTPQMLFVGETAQFSVAAESSPPSTFQWLRDGNPIADATNSYYGVTNLTLSDVADYSVEVKNTIARIRSSSARLQVGISRLGIDRFEPGQPVPLKVSPRMAHPLRIEFSTDLVTWSPVKDLPASLEETSMIDPSASASQQRFYRAVRDLKR